MMREHNGSAALMCLVDGSGLGPTVAMGVGTRKVMPHLPRMQTSSDPALRHHRAPLPTVGRGNN